MHFTPQSQSEPIYTPQVADIVLRYREHKERLIRCSVTSLLPRLASFSPDRFATSYMQAAITYVMGMMRTSNERGLGFSALGELVRAVSPAGESATRTLQPYLPTVVSMIKDAITPRRGRTFCTEALMCVGHLAESLGDIWAPYVDELMDLMFNGGMTDTLVQALSQTAAR